MATCICGRKPCYETWHSLPADKRQEQVTITVPRYALEHAAYLVDLIDGAWTAPYRELAPYLNQPKPDPSTTAQEIRAAQKLAYGENRD